MKMIEVYCDGSVTNALMVDVFKSAIGNEYVGRAMVLVPVLDFGLIEQTRVGMVTMQGQPASNEAEMFAIRSALKVCGALSIADYVVYNDCQGAVAQFTVDHVEWRGREEMYLPNSYFDKVLGRASYLRATNNKVKKRKPAEPHQVEIFNLFQSPRCEFRLSESPLWARVSRDAARHDRALGLSPVSAFASGASGHWLARIQADVPAEDGTSEKPPSSRAAPGQSPTGRYPRNRPCPCGSTRSNGMVQLFKWCHGAPAGDLHIPSPQLAWPAHLPPLLLPTQAPAEEAP